MNLQNSSTGASEKTIDLQGVASFASLVEVLAQELGTNPGKLQGQLPDGPDTFNRLSGELELNTKGFRRKITLYSQPGSPLTMRFQCAWVKDEIGEGPDAVVGGVSADYYLGGTVDSILPQGRALARYVEDIFAVMDRMVTLGHSQKLASMSIPTSKIDAFEKSEDEPLISQFEEPAPTAQ